MLTIPVPVKQARKTPAYWIMMLSSSLWAMIVTAVFFNLLSIFDGLGISPEVAAATYTTYAAAALITQLLLGSLANRGPLQYLLMACLGFLAAGIAVLTVATSPIDRSRLCGPDRDLHWFDLPGGGDDVCPLLWPGPSWKTSGRSPDSPGGRQQPGSLYNGFDLRPDRQLSNISLDLCGHSDPGWLCFP